MKLSLRSLKRLLVSFAVVLLIPVIANLISYQTTQRIVMKKTEEYAFAMLEQIKEIVDSKWEKIYNVSYQLNQNPKIKNLIYATQPFPNSAYYSIWEIQQELVPYMVTDELIADLGVYFLRSELMISAMRQESLHDLYEEYFAQMEEFPTEEAFAQKLYQTTADGSFFPATVITDNDSRQIRVLPFVVKSPTDYSNFTDGYFFYFLDLAEIEQLLTKVDVFKQGNVFVLSGDQIVMQVQNNEEMSFSTEDFSEKERDFIQRDGRVTAYVTSQDRNWRYCIETPSSVLMDNVTYLRYSNWATLLVSLVLGGCIAVWFSIRNTRPIRKLVNAISRNLEDVPADYTDDLQYLEGSVQKLIDHNNSMDEAVRRYRPLLQMEFLNNLLRGEYLDEEEIRAAMSRIEFQLTGAVHRVLLVVISDAAGGGDDSHRVLLRDSIASQCVGEPIYACFVDKDKLAVILSGERTEMKPLEALAASVREYMMGQLGVTATFFASQTCGSMGEIPGAFGEAKAAYEHFWDSDTKREIAFFAEIPEQNDTHFYPFDLQTRLNNLVSSGKCEEIDTALKELHENNFTKKQLPHSERVQLLMEMRGTLLKLYEKYKLDYSLFHIYIEDCNKGTEEVYWHIAQYFVSLSRLSAQMKRDKDKLLYDSVETYIKTHFRDPDLSLTKIGDNFGISEIALSLFYKKMAGQPLSNAIEGLRIEEACRLIAESGQSIGDIALLSGYNNDKSFRRAFKRVKGASPTEYKKMSVEE